MAERQLSREEVHAVELAEAIAGERAAILAWIETQRGYIQRQITESERIEPHFSARGALAMLNDVENMIQER